MIKNERQYKISLASLERFRHALATFTPSVGVSDRLNDAKCKALKSQLAELEAEVLAYEELKSGVQTSFKVTNFSELPLALIRARIARGLTQEQLAGKLGLHQQKVQQYEATDYASASFSRLQEVAEALDVTIENRVMLADNLSGDTLYRKLRALGFDKEFIGKRLVPASVGNNLRQITDRAIVLKAADFAAHVLDLPITQLVTATPAALDFGPLATVRHKLSRSADEAKVNLFSVYAHRISLLALQATRHIPQSPVTEETNDLHDAIWSAYGELNFRSALQYCWDHLGIPVIPMRLHGGFHGATWRIAGRNVIVLNGSQKYVAFWLNDLLHEIGHASQEPELADRTTIEVNPTWETVDQSDDEIDARQFAIDTIFRSRGDQIVRYCEQKAKSVEGLRAAALQVAAEHNIPPDSLALLLASKLEKANWWGAALNLQDISVDAFEIARTHFLQRIDLALLSPPDREAVVLSVQGDEI